MTFSIDPSKTMDENFVDLVNSQAMFPMTADQFTVGPLTVVTPNAGNGNANIKATITATSGGNLEGSSEIFWARIAIGSNVTGVGTTLKVSGADTHEKIQQAIAKMYKIPMEELTWTLPTNVPRPGETATYTVTPTALNKLLLGTARSTSVTNVDDVVLESLEYFFGAPSASGLYNGKKVHVIASTARNLYSNSKQDGKQCFLNLLNLKNLKSATYPITKDLVDVGAVEVVSYAGGGNTVVLVTPKPGCKFSESFYLSYTRLLLTNDTFSSPAGNLSIRYLKGIDVFYAWSQIVNLVPLDEIRFVSLTGEIGTTRTLTIGNTGLPQGYVYAPSSNRTASIG